MIDVLIVTGATEHATSPAREALSKLLPPSAALTVCDEPPDASRDTPLPPDNRESIVIRSGELIPPERQSAWAQKLGLGPDAIRALIWLSGARPEPLSAAILKGGLSRRMGRDKSLIDVNGVPIIERTRDFLASTADTVMLSLRPNDTFSLEGTVAVHDIETGQGPLMGIYTSLVASDTERTLITPCDMPCLDAWTIRQLLLASESHDIAVPSFEKGKLEPLLGVFRKHVAPVSKQLLDSGIRRVSSLFERCDTCVLSLPNTGWYRNLNTQEDYARWLAR